MAVQKNLFQMKIHNKDRPLILVYQAVLTVFMLYDYDKNK
jgi:hypothetical protein